MRSRKAVTRTPHLVCILVAVLVNGCCMRTTGQHLPTRHELDFQLHRNHPEIFYDTKLLPDGAEVTSYVVNRVSSRFFFLVDAGNVPLTISVTPCSSVVSVTILWRTMPKDEDYYYYDEDDYTSYELDEADELWQQAGVRQQGDADSTDTLLVSKTGNEPMTYYNQSAPAGLYSVVVMATQRDTSLRLYATTTPHSDAVYPPLPTNAIVRVTRSSRNAISFAWKAPPATSSAADVQFCVSVNSLRHFRSHCAAHAHHYGDPRPPPPPYAGFGFAKERKGRQRGRQHRRRTDSTPVTETTTARPESEDSLYTCVGTRTRYTYRKPAAGRKYYIDVYAVNTATNASRTYEGVSVTARRRPASKSSRRRMVDGKASSVLLTRSRPEKNLRYRVTGRKSVDLNIYVRSCAVPVPTTIRIQVERAADGHVLADHIVNKSFEKALSVSSVTPGLYRIKVAVADGATVPTGRRYRWTILATIGTVSPYPRLPADARVLQVNNNVTATGDCRSATVAWSVPGEGTSVTQRYCVYVEPVTSSTRLNSCINPRHRRRAVQVSCQVTGPGPETSPAEQQHSGNATMMQVITGMKSGRQYAVDVYASTVTTATKKFLAYERLIFDVPSTC